MKRAFLFINQFYPPDLAPTGRMFRDVAAELTRRGHSVRVVCSRKSYAPGHDVGSDVVVDGVTVRRVAGTPGRSRALLVRAVDDIVFLAAAGAMTLAARADVVVAGTSPPFVGAVAALAAAARGTPHVQWAMDVYPDALRAHGVGVLALPWLWLLEGVARAQFRGATLVLAPGPYVAARLARHLRDGATLRDVPLWSDLEPRPADAAGNGELRTSRGWASRDLVLMYSGNMGRGHRFAEFLAAAERLGPEGPIWAFVGSGPRRVEVEAFRRDHHAARIQLLDYVPASNLAASLRSADVHLVSLRRGWSGIIIPSKLQAAFSAGRPVIFVGPRDNEVADWIAESGGGWIVEEDDVDGLLAAVASARDPTERARRGDAAREYARIHFDRQRNCAQIAALLEGCAADVRPPC